MIYLIYGCSQDLLVNKEIKKALRDNLSEINDFNVTYYDYTQTSIKDIVDDCNTMPFLDEYKGVVVKNFINLANMKSFKEDESKILLEYLSNPLRSTVLVMQVPGNIDEKKEAVKKLKEIARVVKIDEIGKDDWELVISRLLSNQNIDIDDDAKQEFINRTSGDLGHVTAEISKLKTVDSKITLEIVKSLIARPLEENMFGMVDGILNNDPSTSISIYNDLKTRGEEPVRLLMSLATQFRFLYQVKHLKNQGYSNDDIAKELDNIKSGRVFFAIKKIGSHNEDDLLKILDELATLDKQIRSGELDRFLALELFLSKNH